MGYIDLIPDVFRLTMPDLATGKSYHTQKFNVGNKQCIGVTIKASQALSVAVAYGIATDTAAAAGVDIAASLPYKTSATSFASNTSTEGGTYHEIAVPPHARQAQLVISNASGSTVSGAVIDAALRVVAYPAASGSGSSDFASITGWPGSSSQFVHADGSYSPLSGDDVTTALGYWPAPIELLATEATTRDAADTALAAPQYVTLATTSTLANERVLTGTTNQITLTDNGAGGTLVLSTPQDIHTGAAPTFAGVNIGHATDTTLGRTSAGIANIEGKDIVTASDTQTLTNKTLTAPKLANGGFIADANGNESLICVTTASAVNEVTLTNAATGNNPKLSATGEDTNIGIDLVGKGTGVIGLKGPSATYATAGPSGMLFPADHTNPSSCGIWRFGGGLVLNSNNSTLVYLNNGGGTVAQFGGGGMAFPNVHTAPANTVFGSWRDSNAIYTQGGEGCVVNSARLKSRANSTAYGVCAAATGDVVRCLLQDSSSKRAVALVDASGTVTFEAGSHADYVASSSPASGEVGVYISSGILTIKPGSAGARSIAANVARAQA